MVSSSWTSRLLTSEEIPSISLCSVPTTLTRIDSNALPRQMRLPKLYLNSKGSV